MPTQILSSPMVSADSLTIKAYAGRPPAFDKPATQEKYDDVELIHREQQALRKLIREVRIVLRERGEYEGTKLEMLDRYEAKLTELSTIPIALRPEIQQHTNESAPQSSQERKERRRSDYKKSKIE
jgi:hypothetical protein